MIVVDIETTGLDVRKHGIASIGAINFKYPKRQFFSECRIADEIEITIEALRVNGYSEDDLRDPRKPSLKKLLKQFIDWSLEQTCPPGRRNGRRENGIFAAMGPTFDATFLRAAMQDLKLSWPFSHRMIDVHTLGYTHALKRKDSLIKKNPAGFSADTISEYVGLPHEARPHHALNGAKMAAECLARLIYGKNLLPELKSYALPKYLR